MENPPDTGDTFRLSPLPAEIVRDYPPDKDVLFALVRPQITDETLRVIAAGDYGNGFEEHLSGLEKIRAGVDLDVPIGWEPNETLCLFRWSEWDRGKTEFPDSIRFHLARAFCCCALLRVPDHVENRTLYDPNSLIQLIESCRALGKPYQRRLIQQMVWNVSNIEIWEDEDLLYALGLVAAVTEHVGDASHLEPLGDWFARSYDEAILWLREEFRYAEGTFPQVLRADVLKDKWTRTAAGLRLVFASEGRLGKLLATIG